MQQKVERTIVYVDGFNLYYGSLRKTPYKWLDLATLFAKLLDPQQHIIEIKYFTARVSSRDGSPQAPQRQKAYLLAIEKYIPNIYMYYGHYLSHPVMAKVCDPLPNQPPYLRVIKTEEKGSDVNIALHILNDAWLDKYDCAVLVSNDSDLAEALRFAKEDHKKKIGLVVPGDEKYRKASRELSKYATFTHRISKTLLSESQLPNPIPGTNIYKPATW